MTDPLAEWWRHEVSVQRWLGTSAYGDVYDPATLHMGAVDEKRRLVRDKTGAEVVSETTVRFPATTAAVPPGSLVTLPAAYGGRTSVVIAASRHDGGGQPTPDHLELALA